MLNFWKKLLETDFLPHGHCYFWRPEIVWLHVVSDSLITLSYYSIPFALIQFLRKRRGVPFHWMFLMFAAFIFACGTTHLVNIWTLWIPVYRLDGMVKLGTALVSVASAAMLWPLIPKAVALPGPEQLSAANRKLEREVHERRHAEERLRQSEQVYRLLFDDNPLPMYVFHRESLRVLAVNDAALRLLGWSREELLRMTIEDLRPPEDLPALRASLWDWLAEADDSARPGVVRLRRKDGTLVEVDPAWRPLSFEEQAAVLVLANDVTELQRVERRFRGLLESAPDAMVIVDQGGTSCW